MKCPKGIPISLQELRVLAAAAVLRPFPGIAIGSGLELRRFGVSGCTATGLQSFCCFWGAWGLAGAKCLSCSGFRVYRVLGVGQCDSSATPLGSLRLQETLNQVDHPDPKVTRTQFRVLYL